MKGKLTAIKYIMTIILVCALFILPVAAERHTVMRTPFYSEFGDSTIIWIDRNLDSLCDYAIIFLRRPKSFYPDMKLCVTCEEADTLHKKFKFADELKHRTLKYEKNKKFKEYFRGGI